MVRRNDNNDNNNNNNGGNNMNNESQFSLEEVGKLIGSAVASAIKEYENSNNNNNNYSDDDYDENGNLRRNKDGSIDKRQFNSGRGNDRRDEDNQTA